jgi:hypothetical protein
LGISRISQAEVVQNPGFSPSLGIKLDNPNIMTQVIYMVIILTIYVKYASRGL